MVKSILRKSKTDKKQTKRVHFNKYKKVKTIRKRLAITKKNKKQVKGKSGKPKSKGKKKGKQTRKGVKKQKTTRRKSTIKRKQLVKRKPKLLKLKMKGGCGSNMGEKVTGIPNNSNPQQQYPESTNLNSSIPTPYQNGGSMWDTFGLGDVPLIKNGIMNSAKNALASATGAEKTVTANPAVHPEMSKSLVKYPEPIDVKSLHAASKLQADAVSPEN